MNLSSTDILIIILFFAGILLIGFYTSRKTTSEADDYLLAGRKIGLFLFILTNVSTWYGGILGVGEFTYRYGIVSWFTQGLPYYLFAFLFAIFFAKKIREASLFTIPDKLSEIYGKKVGMLSAVIVFILVSPAPYLLMTVSLLSYLFQIPVILSILIALVLSIAYLLKGGFKSNVFVDSFQFFVMFVGFIAVVIFSLNQFGGFKFISDSVPTEHLDLSGGMPVTYLIVWFLIALWTFADPGFHQRCYAAKSGNVAMKGIIISIFFWALFDFLTTITGLFAKGVLPDIQNPVLAFPKFADEVLPVGLKGIFYAALFATILSTLNSFLFLSATTISRDFIFKFKKFNDVSKLRNFTIAGLIISGILAGVLAYTIPSVIEIWYTIGSLFIPGIILPVVSAYYPKLRVSNKIILIEMIAAVLSSVFWYFVRNYFSNISFVNEIEPMLVGLIVSLGIHFGTILNRLNSNG